MSSIILPEDHITFTSSDEVSDSAKLFKKIGIFFVDYVRVYEDRTRLHLTTSRDWTDFFLKNYYSEKCLFFEKDKSTKDNFWFSFSNLWNKFNDPIVTGEIENKFAIGNGITIARKQNGYIEYFYLATAPDNNQIYNLYLNNAALLNQCTFDFKEKLNPLIKAAAGSRILAPKPQIDATGLIEVNNLEDLDIERYYFYENDLCDYLSKREYECLKLAAQGKSTLETGHILSISNRTVEQHLKNVKMKFNCVKIQHLIYKALKKGIPL